MTQDQVSVKVAGAQKNIEAAMEALMRMDVPASDCSKSLQTAADLLTDVERAHVLLDSARFQESLAALAKQVNAAGVLLESAAALHFGNVLYGGVLDGGYQQDGAISSFGGEGFRIEG